MSLFSNPTEHAANPPSTWTVAASGRRWKLCTADGGVLDSFERKRAAEDAKTAGWLVDMYDKESRWYAGEPVSGWKPYAPPASAPASAPAAEVPAVPAEVPAVPAEVPAVPAEVPAVPAEVPAAAMTEPATPAPGIVGPGMRVLCDAGAVPGYRHITFGRIVSVGPKHTRVVVGTERKPKAIPNEHVRLDPPRVPEWPADERDTAFPLRPRYINPRTGKWLPRWSWLRWSIAEHQAFARGERPAEDAPDPAPRRLVIVSCGGLKLERDAAARDIYTGGYFRKARQAADALERREGDYQVILSAKYGLLDLDDSIEPYDVRMGDPDAIGVEAVRYQAGQLGLLDAAEVIVLAGRAYADVVSAVWPHARRPLDGTAGMGEQLRVMDGIYRAGRLPDADAPAPARGKTVRTVVPADPWADLFGMPA